MVYRSYILAIFLTAEHGAPLDSLLQEWFAFCSGGDNLCFSVVLSIRPLTRNRNNFTVGGKREESKTKGMRDLSKITMVKFTLVSESPGRL